VKGYRERVVEEDPAATPKKGSFLPIVLTAGIMLLGVVLTSIFKSDVLQLGTHLLTTYGQGWVDGTLFLLTAVSSTPLVLPIWPYTLVGVSLGYGIVHLAVVMALGSATGSLVEFYMGRYFGQSAWFKKRFPNGM
jgi:hypothetical protein